jgi:hypothetical protein
MSCAKLLKEGLNDRQVLDCGSPLPLSRRRVNHAKAAEGCRSPGRYRALCGLCLRTDLN